MDASTLSGLEWLEPLPPDFAARCAAIPQAQGPRGDEIRRLATYRAGYNELSRLRKAIEACRAMPRALEPLVPLRLALTSNATTHFVATALVATAARHGFALECIEGGFDQTVAEALDARSPLNRCEPDAVLLALDHRALNLDIAPGDVDAADRAVRAALERIAALRRAVHERSGAVCIVQTLARPPQPLFGSLDLRVAGTLRMMVEAFNRGLAESLDRSPDLLLDVAGIAEAVGLERWHDPAVWNLAKSPFSHDFLPSYAEAACRLLGAWRGKARKCLVLDLDNTLWGGVVGDDGVGSLLAGPGDPTGEAHAQLQAAALSLRGRGVVLAVCSKNDDSIARTPFREHPGMLLREEHFAVFQANWGDKATNLRAIARSLSLGLDALVFVDDNPAERRLVRELLPEVAVPELPADPAFYARTLLAAGYFEATVFSDEDRRRAQAYADNARRAELLGAVDDVDRYLESLAMRIRFQPFDDAGRARIAQLVNKSNQFNLTTRRYDEAQLARIAADPACFTLQVRLADVFGDSGMISVVIARRQGDDWDIDTWLMSCRVLGRRVEEAVLAELVREARARGVGRLLGTYIPTGRNQLVEPHYARLGFELLGRDATGTSRWQLLTDSFRPVALPLQREAQPEAASTR